MDRIGALAEAAALPGAVAAGLGLEVGPGEPLAALRRAASPLSLLLALDNAEHHVAAVAGMCRALLEAAPQLRLLVTSQATLRVAGEHVFRLGPLAVPERALPASSARRFGAVALFAARAQAADARFALTGVDADADIGIVIEICRALDGLPLAIELAAARAPLLGLRPLWASMPERLRVLTRGPDRDAPPRQRTLRDALAWSHDLLAPAEQRAFRRLGVVAGSASLDLILRLLSREEMSAAMRSGPTDRAEPAGGNDVDADLERIEAQGQREPWAPPDQHARRRRRGQSEPGDEGDQADRWQVLDLVDGLVDRSLLAVWSAPGAEAPRYRLPESARAYALERLREAGEEVAWKRRHALALAAVCDEAYEQLFRGEVGVDRWCEAVAADFDNAREAVSWARAAGEAQTLLTVAATLLRALPPSLHAERMALADLCEAQTGVPVPEPLQWRVWIELASAWADTQKLRSRDAAERALRLARRLRQPGGDRFALYLALCRHASAAAQAGDLEAAHAPLAELRQLEDPRWPAQRLLWGAEAEQVHARLRGDAAETLRLSRRLVALDRARGSDAAISLGNLVDHELAAGDAEAATRTGAELVAVLAGTRHEYSLAFARLNLCAAWLALDDAAAARAVAAEAWPQALRFELQHCAAAYLALLAALEGRPRCAARLLGHARAGYTARAEAVEANEAQAMQRAQEAAEARLGVPLFAAARAEGARLGVAEVEALAFANVDT